MKLSWMTVPITLGKVWSLPNTLLGLLMAVFLGASRPRYRDGAIEIRVRRIPFRTWFPTTVGQTWGTVIYTDARLESYDRLWRHELRHVKQSLVLGPLFALAYPVASLVAWLTGGHFYRDNWFERDATAAESGTPSQG